MAKKYIVKHLESKCLDFLDRSLNAQDVCIFLKHEHLIGEDLIDKCWKTIDENIKEVMKADTLEGLYRDMLHRIISRDSLECREKYIFDGVLRWAQSECKRRGLQTSREHVREVLGDTMYQLRPTRMTQLECAKIAEQSEIFTLDEAYDLFLHFSTIKRELPFVSRPRGPLQECAFLKFYDTSISVTTANDGIQFSVNRPVLVEGFEVMGLYHEGGVNTVETNYSVVMELKHGNDVLAKQNTTKLIKHDTCITFDSPFLIEPDTFYTARAVLEGPQPTCVADEAKTVFQLNDVTFKFKYHKDPSTTEETVENIGGHISAILFRY